MSLPGQILQYFFSGAANGSVYILIALGFNIIYNATGIINFAQGEFVVLGGFAMVTLTVAWKVPTPIAFALTVAGVAAIGGLFERVAIHPLKKPGVITLIIITIGGAFFFQGAAMLWNIAMGWNKEAVSLPPFPAGKITVLDAMIKAHALWILGIVAMAAAALFLFFEYSITGKAMRACAEDRETSQLMGIHVDRMVLLSFVLSAALGAVAGIVYTPMAEMEYTRGPGLALKGFETAVIGGLGNSVGAVIAGLLLGVFEQFTAGFLTSTFKEAVTLGLMLFVLFVRPSGILGKSEIARLKEF